MLLYAWDRLSRGGHCWRHHGGRVAPVSRVHPFRVYRVSGRKITRWRTGSRGGLESRFARCEVCRAAFASV